jgi:hypothetical protein
MATLIACDCVIAVRAVVTPSQMMTSTPKPMMQDRTVMGDSLTVPIGERSPRLNPAGRGAAKRRALLQWEPADGGRTPDQACSR